MKQVLIVLSALVAIVTLMASTMGAPSGVAGDPASASATCRNCHSGPALAPLTGVITSNIPPAGYTPGNTYTITANFARPGHAKFGFEISPQNPSGTLMGSMALLNSQTKLVGMNKYITHTATGVNGSGSKSWSFRWTAPASGLGPVTFYGAFNATNANSMNSGDSIFKSTLTVTENVIAVQNFLKNNHSFSIFPNPSADYLNVNFILQKPTYIEIDLFDISGNRVMAVCSEENMNGEINKFIDLSSFRQGIYLLCLKADDSYSVQRIIKTVK